MFEHPTNLTNTTHVTISNWKDRRDPCGMTTSSGHSCCLRWGVTAPSWRAAYVGHQAGAHRHQAAPSLLSPLYLGLSRAITWGHETHDTGTTWIQTPCIMHQHQHQHRQTQTHSNIFPPLCNFLTPHLLWCQQLMTKNCAMQVLTHAEIGQTWVITLNIRQRSIRRVIILIQQQQ